MSTEKLRAVTTILNSAANKRIRRAEKLGTKSEVIENAKKAGKFKTSRITKSTTPEKARATAEAEFMRVKLFLQKETSSTRGTKKVKRKTINKFVKKAKKLDIIPKETEATPWISLLDIREGQDLNDLIWGAVDKLSETKPLTKEGRYRVADAAYDIIIKDKRIKKKNTVFKKLEKWAQSNYEESIQEFEDVGDEELATIFKDFT